MVTHLISGDAAAGCFRAGGGKGEVLVWREALIGGPLRDGPGWLETRARFLAPGSGRDVAACRQDLAAQELAIAAALGGDELVLWFARDLFCELGLLRVLAGIADAPDRRAALWLVCPDDSGTADFLCFGELAPPAVVALASRRRPVDDDDLAAATRAWAAVTSSDPTALDRFLSRPPTTAVEEIAADALTKQRARFPSFTNGLGRTEQTALELCASGAGSFAGVLAGIGEVLPGYGWTDVQLATELAALAVGAAPLVDIIGAASLEPAALVGARLAITTSGLSVLRATSDRIDACDIDTWIGGVHVTAENLWRFDETAQRLLPS